MDTMKQLVSSLPGAETATKTLEAAEEKVKQVVSSIPVVGQSETVKHFIGLGGSKNHEETGSQGSTMGLQQAGITPIESSQERPQTIGERVKPVLSSAEPKTEEKQAYFDKIIEHTKYFASEIKETQNSRIYARAILKGQGGVLGDLTFGQDLSTGETCCVGSMIGLPPGKHAVNIHEYGDLAQGHASIGPHFNPFHATKHGQPQDAEHHVGDLGNITAGVDGRADVDLCDLEVPLVGPFSVIGRAVEVHAAGDMDMQSVPPCDCPSACECRSGGARCPRAHECAMCEAMMKMGEPIAIGIIVHAPEIKQRKPININQFTKPWESLRGTTD